MPAPPHGGASFNPRSPRGGATPITARAWQWKTVSIHAPREGERRVIAVPPLARGRRFNPRSPRGGATRDAAKTDHEVGVSIHAPREGERHAVGIVIALAVEFQSTLPARGSDVRPADAAVVRYVSIHAPREGERPAPFPWYEPLTPVSIHAPREGERLARRVPLCRQRSCFNPRSPRGGATRRG